MSEQTKERLKVGGEQTGPTCPSTRPFCGDDWPYSTVQYGMETVAACPDQALDRRPGFRSDPKRGTGKANAQHIVACWNAALEANLSTTALENGVVKDALAALQMAVDYYTLPVNEFEDKYPVRPPEPKELAGGGCWTAVARAVLAKAREGGA